MVASAVVPAPEFWGEEDIGIDEFDALCSQSAKLDEYSFADAVEQNVVIYAGDKVREALATSKTEAALKAELSRCLKDGPGIFAVQGAYPNTVVIDKSTAVFKVIIADEKSSGQAKGDHFGDNERIWNSLQKVCLRNPDLFIDYYGNPILAVASEAWLGPHYQMTAQVNIVKPGGMAQSAHRDYHLGFQSDATIDQFPAHAQSMSQYLTLQGAIVHSDMPLESGPTLFLPFSHQYLPGYRAYRKPEFVSYFDEHKVQLPFKKGDAVFFNPALFHGAGANTTSADRIANLVQISSAFGRPMETINRYAMIEAVYPVLLARVEQGAMSERMVHDTIAAVADGYSFPTNLDSDPPVGGNAPVTAQQLMSEALQNRRSPDQLVEALNEYALRRQA